MEQELSNVVSVLGNYNDIPTTITSEAVLVTMLDGLTVTKSADKQVWADGYLTYTIVVDNKTNVAYSAPVITDILNTSLITFVTGSVTIDGEKAEDSKVTYVDSTGTLTVTLDDLAPSTSSTITFQVSKKV